MNPSEDPAGDNSYNRGSFASHSHVQIALFSFIFKHIASVCVYVCCVYIEHGTSTESGKSGITKSQSEYLTIFLAFTRDGIHDVLPGLRVMF